jgi:uncharacterized protein (DUF1697 family)
MTAYYVALLRAVNVSGTGKLPMSDLKAMGEACGFNQCRTFIASGNLLFASEPDETEAQQRIARRIEEYFGKAVPVHVRSAAEMAEAVAGNPFASEPGNRVVALFTSEKPTQATIDAATGINDERLALGPRLIYICYGDGMADSKLKLPAMRDGTARNMNSVAKMAGLLAGME